MKTFQLSLSLFALMVFTTPTASVFANQSTATSGSQIMKVEIATEDNPRISPLSKRYKKGIRMEKRAHESLMKKAKRKMFRRILGKKWKQLWSKQY